MFRWLLVVLWALFTTGCLLPFGSVARPVKPLSEGQSLVGAAVSFPFGAVGKADVGEEEPSFSVIGKNFATVPLASYDYAVDDGALVGLSLGWLALAGGEAQGFYINPRFEMPFSDKDRGLTFTADARVVWYKVAEDSFVVPSPTVGVRGYIPVYSGGLILSQSIGTGFITLIAPGGVGYDLELFDIFHVIPEFRWDPTVFFIGGASGIISFFSAGLALMVVI